ncbi:hypothetical protein AD998_20280 [bacterium 336/3]|nr:hypothetical protein AD998_20280 [bacterium 336/3]
MKTLCSFLLLCVVAMPLYAQKKDTTLKNTHAIKLLGQASPDKILLRWAASSPYAWKISTEQGVVVERQLIVKSGKVLSPKPAFVKLTTNPLKPLALKDWETLAKKNQFAAIAAQALYGKSFQVSQGAAKTSTTKGMVEMLNQSTELENRYSFALFASDVSKETAQAAALYLEDADVKKDEMYLYKVYVASRPKNTLAIDTGYVYVGVSDYRPLPQIRELHAEFSDKSVLLSWDKNPYNKYFTAYQIERSEDGGKTFKATSELPFLNTEPYGAKEDLKKNFYVDSLKQNQKEYFYRIKGMNAFGQISLPSDTVSGMGYIPLRGNPSITKAYELKNGHIQVEWQFPSETLAQVKGFQIERSKTEQSGFEPLNTQILPVTTTFFVDNKPERSNYYRIKALGKKEGEYALSFPYRVLAQDSIAPNIPEGLEGVVDSNGVVKLTWKKGKEIDLYGYRVFRSNFENQEYSQVSKEPIRKTVFYDTINIKTLSKKVFYKIVALDEVFNASDFSKALLLKRPDKIPPTEANFIHYEALEEGIFLKWASSSSEDVKKHLLYRKEQGSKDWKLIQMFEGKSIQNYLDKDTDLLNVYAYILVAVDESGLESKPSKPIMAKRLDMKIRRAIEKFEVVSDRTNKEIRINWEYPEKDVYAFWIYRSEKGKPLRLLTSTLDVNAKSYIDKEASLNREYQYAIQAIFKDNARSKMSKVILVVY